MLAAQGEKRAEALPPSSDMADNRANSADVRSFRSEDAIKNELPRCGSAILHNDFETQKLKSHFT